MPRFMFSMLEVVTTILSLMSLKSVRQPQRIFIVAGFLLLGVAGLLQAQTSPTPTAASSSTSAASSTTAARDPGVRGGAAGAGGPIAGLTAGQSAFFNAGQQDFQEVEAVANGLGPRMNLDSCAGCHAQPAIGGTSPKMNPQVAFASAADGIPYFITADGPVREARFKFNPDGTRDGGVHNTATITGRPGTGPGCMLTPPDFAGASNSNNIIFKIPTPLFGAGLIEQIPDSAIVANQAADPITKQQLGIRGRPNFAVSGRTITGDTNNNGNDGTIARFGWKAQNQTLLLFSGEAYNVEMGISNELFQQEREQYSKCQYATVPNDLTDTTANATPGGLSAIEKFAFFQQFLAPPTPSPNTPGGATSIGNGQSLFMSTGCALCHTPKLTTGNSTVAALRNQTGQPLLRPPCSWHGTRFG